MAMDVFEAITEMRRISKKGGEFSMSFMSYSMKRRKSEGVVFISRARLSKQANAEKVAHADDLLNFVDLDRGEYHRCYQPLLMTFEGNQLNL